MILSTAAGARRRERRRACASASSGVARSGEGRRQDRVLRPRRQRPDREEPEVKQKGGLGMIMANTSRELAQRRPALRAVDPRRRRGRQRRSGRTSRGQPGRAGDDPKGTVVFNQPAPFVAAFSSRGPVLAGIGGEDIMKPDFMAPGEDILAAVAPEGNHGRDVRHAQRHVDVEPARGRLRRPADAGPSGLVAGGDAVGAGDDGVRLRHGDGRRLQRRLRPRNPTTALDPGLVYDAGTLASRSCRVSGSATACRRDAPAIDASDLNQRVDRDRRAGGHRRR